MTETVLRTESDRRDLIRAIEALDLGKTWRVEIKRPQRRRSLQANALYWEWVGIAAAELGYDKQDLHEALMEAADCPHRAYRGMDGTMRRRRSTSGLSTQDFAAYMDRVYRLVVGEIGIVLPLPEHV